MQESIMKCGKAYDVKSTNPKMSGSDGKMPYAGSYRTGGVVSMNRSDAKDSAENDRLALKFLNQSAEKPRAPPAPARASSARMAAENDKLAVKYLNQTEPTFDNYSPSAPRGARGPRARSSK
jgi:hypothetical protein